MYDNAPYPLTGDRYFAVAEKEQILADWQRFIHSGFKQLFFSRPLYRFLHLYCGFTAHFNQANFWAVYFNAEISHTTALLNQFGGDGRSVECGTTAWLNEPVADLKQALCRETDFIMAPVLQVLTDLEYRHAEMGRLWRDFAGEAGLEAGFPAEYQVSRNTRSLLAYALAIARQQQSPLRSLQIRFPPAWLPATPALDVA